MFSATCIIIVEVAITSVYVIKLDCFDGCIRWCSKYFGDWGIFSVIDESFFFGGRSNANPALEHEVQSENFLSTDLSVTGTICLWQMLRL